MKQFLNIKDLCVFKNIKNFAGNYIDQNLFKLNDSLALNLRKKYKTCPKVLQTMQQSRLYLSKFTLF